MTIFVHRDEETDPDSRQGLENLQALRLKTLSLEETFLSRGGAKSSVWHEELAAADNLGDRRDGREGKEAGKLCGSARSATAAPAVPAKLPDRARLDR